MSAYSPTSSRPVAPSGDLSGLSVVDGCRQVSYRGRVTTTSASASALPPRDAASWLRQLTRSYPDFPTPGILFRDLTPVFANGDAFAAVVDELAQLVLPGVIAVAGVEARGFLLAAAIAQSRGCGVVAVRKAGKLPGAVLTESYELEYGRAQLEIHADVLEAGARVVLVDDLLATGGTLTAATRLLERAGCVVDAIGVVVELDALKGRDRLEGHRVVSILSY